MEFVNRTGHIFSLPSYKEKPIGYEYEEYSYIFWIDAYNSSKLSVNNFYSRPIYALYKLDKNYSISELENEYNPIIDIEIYSEKSNVFKLISSKELQAAISREDFNLNDYVNLNELEETIVNYNIEYKDKYNFIKEKLINNDLYCVKTFERLNDTTVVDYLMIPIYPIAMAKEAGTWITNYMIHIHNNDTNEDEWCYISVGGEFVEEYEELVINGQNMGVRLPKDILKAVYSESLYNDEFNEALYNEKIKEYMLNYMNIKGNIGNFKSAINSLKWFGYGDRISISKLLRTDNEFKTQYILNYFDLSNDILESFKTFVSTALISLMIMINKESDEQWPFNFYDNHIDKTILDKYEDENGETYTQITKFYGENRPKMISLIGNYHKIKLGNHDMPIEEDIEKYWWWKPYFDFSFNELGLKLICLSYYYKKYFLPIHLNIHSTSLGYRVFANNIKLTTSFGIVQSHPSIILNNKNEVRFLGEGEHYFTKQIHYIDENFNEYCLNDKNIENDNREWYYLNDTCVNIPIEFINNEFNKGYYNCVLLLEKVTNRQLSYTWNKLTSFNGSLRIKNTTFDNKLINWVIFVPSSLKINKVYDLDNNDITDNFYIETINKICDLDNNDNYININEEQKTLDHEYLVFTSKNKSNNIDIILKNENYNNDLDISELNCKYYYCGDRNVTPYIQESTVYKNVELLYESHFSFCQSEDFTYKNFIIYPKKLNIKVDNNKIAKSNYFEYWANNEFNIKLLVNNKWYEYDFKLKIHKPTIDFGKLTYRYYYNDRNYLFSKILKNNNESLHNIILTKHNDLSTKNMDFTNIDSVDRKYIKYFGNSLESTVINHNGYWIYNFNDENLFNTLYFIIWPYINTNDIDNEIYIYKNYVNTNYTIDDLEIIKDKIHSIFIENKTMLFIPKNWGKPFFIEEGKNVNNYIYEKHNLIDNNSWIETFDFNEADHIYQFFKQNYNNLSPFTQIKKIDDDNKRILFNSYMHNHQLVDVNDINFDIDFNKILEFHLIHNLQYIDGTLINNSFYQYIEYSDINGKPHIVYLDKDLIGSDIDIMFNSNELNNFIVCAYNGKIYLLNEEYDFDSDYIHYLIIDAEKNYNEYLFEEEEIHEDTGYLNKSAYLIYDTIHLKYDSSKNSYYSEFINGKNSSKKYYEIYDRLYFNANQLNLKYSALANLPNNMKYKNSLHLFNIYTLHTYENNVLSFKNNIDMYIDGIRFIHNITNDLNNNDDLKIYLDGTLTSNIDSRFPDTYGLYFANPIEVEHLNDESLTPNEYSDVLPKLPTQEIPLEYNFGFYVKRNYRNYYDPFDEEKQINLWEVSNIFEYTTEEFSYYYEAHETYIGSYLYKTLDDFYNNNPYESNLEDEYKFIDDNGGLILKNINNEHIYYFNDINTLDIYDLTKYIDVELSYTVEFYKNNILVDVSINDIESNQYNKVKINFYYHKPHIVRNQFYMIHEYLDYLNELKDNNKITEYTYNNEIIEENGKYYYNLTIDGANYKIELNDYRNIYKYIDVQYKNEISIQNPSTYWYNLNKNKLESLHAHVNEIKRLIINANNKKFEDLNNELKILNDYNTLLNYDKLLKDINVKDSEKSKLKSKFKDIVNLCKLIDDEELQRRYNKDGKIAQYKYKSYLTRDITGFKGTYRLEVKDSNINIKAVIEIIKKDDDNNVSINYIIKKYENENDVTVELTGDELKVTVFIYIFIDNNEIEKWVYNPEDEENNKYIIVKLIHIVTEEHMLKYIPKEHTSNDNLNYNLIKVNYMNQNFIYGDNNCENTYDLYKEFFKLKFNVYDSYINYNQLNTNLLYSVYECVDELKLNEYLNYDFYLMHDDKYWYGLYISQETCNFIRDYKDLKLKDEDKYKILNNKYILRHYKSSEEYLINRLEFNSSHGLNQFNNDDIIACYIHNNDRLPFNGSISSKWNIHPMSLGMSTDTSFESNGEMTILSLPKNDAKYERGYYKVTVKYSLDRDIQHQFKNTSTIRIS